MPKSSFAGELIHTGSVRFRVTGSGVLDLDLHSLDEASHTAEIPSITLQAATNREPTVLANFIDQCVQLEFGTDEIDEVFTIDRIIIFIRPVATGYPQ